MKHIVKIITLLMAISAMWIGLLEMSVVPRSQTWLLPIYFTVSLGCYGLLMVGIGLMRFPTCPQEALLLQQVGTLLLVLSGFLEHFIELITPGTYGSGKLYGSGVIYHCISDIVEAKHYLNQRGVHVGSE